METTRIQCRNCQRTIEISDRTPGRCPNCDAVLLPETVDFRELTKSFSPTATGASENDEMPATLGEYRRIRELGRGGMGVVWEAEHLPTGRHVALKLLANRLSHSADSEERFVREARIAATLSHPRTTFVFEAGQSNGRRFIAMELMPGRTLRDLVEQEEPLTIHRAVDLILDVIDGLAAAHAEEMVHRDVKPSNCFIDHDGQVKIGDFGLSKSTSDDASVTQTGAFLGTPEFAAPEQVRGEPATPQTDIYCVGATLFYLLTRRGPFSGNAVAVIAQIVSSVAPSVRSIRPDVPRGLSEIIAKTLEKEPQRRFANCRELREALLPFSTGGTVRADLFRRFSAYAVDSLLFSYVFRPIVTPVFQITVAPVRQFWHVDHQGMVIEGIVYSFLPLAYFALTELRWGRGLGKWMLGLRVQTLEGERPNLRQALIRAFVFPGDAPFRLAIIALLLLLVDHGIQISGNAPRHILLITMSLPFVGLTIYMYRLLCLTSMRLRNGYRGWHEWASGTRVVQLKSDQAQGEFRPLKCVEARSWGSDESPSFGAFRVIGDYGERNGIHFYLAKDVELARFVWIWHGDIPSELCSPPTSAAMRSIRMRWLQAGISETDGRPWIALESVRGAPVTSLSKKPKWEEGRDNFLSLARELNRSAKEGLLPERLSLEQIWITHIGQIRIVEFPIPVVRDKAKQNADTGDAPHRPETYVGEEGKVGSRVCDERVAAAVSLLREFGAFVSDKQLLPENIHQFLEELQAAPATTATLEWIEAELVRLQRQPSSLSRRMRFSALANTAFVELPLFTLCFVVIPILGLCLPSILAAWLRGGIALQMLRLAVYDRATRRLASRWRCAARALTTWGIWAVSFGVIGLFLMFFVVRMAAAGDDGELITQEIEQSGPRIAVAASLISTLLIAFVVGVFAFVVSPQRGIQDLLCRTYIAFQPFDVSEHSREESIMALMMPIGRNGWAVLAGYVGLFAPLPGVGVVSIIVATIALRSLHRHPETTGKGRAIFALVIGLTSTLVWTMAGMWIFRIGR